MQTRGLQTVAVLFKLRARSFPFQLVRIIKYRHVQSESGKRPVKNSIVPLLEQYGAEPLSASDRRVPLPPVPGHIFKVRVLRKCQSGPFCAPAWKSWKTVRAVSYHGEVVRN